MLKADGGELVAQLGPTSSTPGRLVTTWPVVTTVPTSTTTIPKGNPQVATQVHEARRIPERQVHGGYIVKVVGSTGDPASKTAAIANAAAQSLGFKTNFTLVDSR